jgi:uncharacterized protein (TIRG00374 family)
LVFIGLVLVGDLRQIGTLVSSFQWSLYPLVIAFTLLNYSLRFIKWHYYLGQIGVFDLTLAESARLFVAGFPLAVTPGKVGEALKAVWLNQATGVPISRGVSVVLAERISDGLAVMLLSTLGVIAYPRYWPAFCGVLVLLLGVVIVSQIRSVSLALIRFSQRIPVIKRYAAAMGEFYEGSYLLFRPRTTLTAVGLGTVSWLGEGIGLYLILIGLGIPPGWDRLSIAVFVLSFSTVIGAVSALPGGLGAAEFSIAGMLTLLLGLEADFSTTATLLIRFATLWFGVGLGLITWTFSRDLISLRADTGSDAGL